MPVQGSPPPPVPVKVLPEEGLPHDPPTQPQEQEVRRSTRSRVEPQRLNIGSWKGQTYESASSVHNGYLGVGTYQNPRMFGTLGNLHSNMTTPYSVVHYHGLPHSVPGGGGGISGYALPSGLLPSSYQTIYWPGSHVNSRGLSVPQLGYYGLQY